ncbi:MAG: phosphatidate cytidylyltransferase, partial [Acidobacteria bacterium]|nr:phosphatidate cytidylyltransferase [Acidobacteriota bacterium]
MKRVLTAAVLIPLVLLVVLRAPLWLFTAVAGVVALLAMREYLGLVAQYGANPFHKLVLGLAGTGFALLTLGSSSVQAAQGEALTAAIGIYLGSPFLLLLLAMTRPDPRTAVPDVAMGSLALPYVAFPLALLVGLRTFPAGWFFVLALFLSVWAGDIAAYYVGSNLGRHRMSPSISPK